MKTGPQVTEQEIASFMDFDALLKQKDDLLDKRRSANLVRKIIGLISMLLLAALVTTLTWKGASENTPSPVEKEATAPGSTSMDRDSLQVAATPVMENRKDTVVQRSQATQKPARPEQSDARAVPSPKNEINRTLPVYIQPAPVDGYLALYDYFDRALRYPAHAEGSAEGVVTVAFVIDATGKAAKITIEKSMGDEFDQEARRLIKNMPLWRPATYGGKPVESKVSLPITFSVQKALNPQER